MKLPADRKSLLAVAAIRAAVGLLFGLYFKVPEKGLTLILLANSEGLWWSNPLDRAEVERSPFAAAFMKEFF